MCSRSASPRPIRTTSFRSIAARSSIPASSGALDAAWALAEPLIAIGKPLDIQITATDNGLDVDVRGSGPLPSPMIAALSRLAEQHRLARLTRHGELVLMRMPPTITIGTARVTLPPGSFLQATVAGEETLAALVPSMRKAKDIVDLFCGVGPFALRLAEKARVTAFDSDAGAVAALAKAARDAGAKTDQGRGARPVSPSAGAAGVARFRCRRVRSAAPGRAGARPQLAASKVPVVIAVSCNVATFARDARLLIDGGYRIEGVMPVDQFRHTPHVASRAARFSR